ncbi:hypothetical protein [Methanomethylophilus alvi]|uniref:hypothetical protein n=1 Tax=Methanomethylophilus alvi TaxID=1291540 RepID=UPI0037DCF3C2
MKIYDAYKLAIQTGIDHDPRPRSEIDLVLSKAKKAYDALDDDKKELFDTESLWNPYYDCRFSWGEDIAKEKEAQRLMWGVDISTAEVLLADRLREKGEEIDAVVCHHPLGKSRNPFPKVMWMQTDIYHDCGVPINVAEGLMKPRMDEVLYNVGGDNFNRAADAARLLGIPMFNIHSAADNMVQEYLENKIKEAEPKRLQDVIDLLMTEPEYRYTAKLNDPPKIIIGDKESRCGGIIAKMTGGTSGPTGIYEELAKAGVGTIVGMHFPNSAVEACRKCHMNMIISGHMSSDSLGINLICDVWEKHGIEVFGTAGFSRFSRN